MLKLMFLTEKFYKDYAKCPEIEQKTTRPYVRIQVVIDGVLWGIPLRSNISHKHVIWTDQGNGCGIDLTKAVAIAKPKEYIDKATPYIRGNEFAVLKTIDDYWVRKKFESYVKAYKKAKEHPEIKRSQNLLTYSTLQYFEEYI